MITFDDITNDGRLWAVRYEGDADNILSITFERWTNATWLSDFFSANIEDLESYFKITDLNQAIYDTVEDADRLQCLILDINEDADLDKVFRHLEPSRSAEMILGKEKAKGKYNRHASWLRLYAIRLSPGKYIITGGAIKLTATMQERKHTLQELTRLEFVRNFLLDEGIIDDEGFNYYMKEP